IARAIAIGVARLIECFRMSCIVFLQLDRVGRLSSATYRRGPTDTSLKRGYIPKLNDVKTRRSSLLHHDIAQVVRAETPSIGRRVTALALAAAIVGKSSDHL